MIQPGLLAGALHAAPVSVGDLTAQSLTVGVAATIDFTTQVSVASDAALTAGTWSVQSGTVPSGMTHTDGVVSGTPDTTQSATTLTLRYTNSGGYVDVGGAITVVAAVAAPVAAGAIGERLVQEKTGVIYADYASAFTGSSISYAIDSAPTGVAINPSTGVVSFDTNTMSRHADTTITLRATNGGGTATNTFSLTCGPQLGVVIPYNLVASSELFANGTFADASQTAIDAVFNSTWQTSTKSIVNGAFRITNGAAAYSSRSHDITVIPGRTYRVRATVKDTGTAGGRVTITWGAGGSETATTYGNGPGLGDVTFDQTVVPTQNYIRFAITTNSATDAVYSDFDNLYVTEDATAKRDAAFSIATDMHAKYVRCDFPCRWIFYGTSTSRYWDTPDDIYARAAAAGVRLLFVITGIPDWAIPSGGANNSYPDPSQQANMVTALQEAAARYPNAAWEFLNEQNHPTFAADRNPAAYMSYASAAVPAMRTANANAVIISNGLSPAASTTGGYILADDYVQQMYDNGLTSLFNGIGHHPYFYPYTWDGNSGGWNGWSGVMEGDIYDVMVAESDQNRWVWMTEVGGPTGGSASHWTTTQQGDYMITAWKRAAALSWTGPLFVYSAYDRGDESSTDVEDHFGVYEEDYATPKYAVSAYQKLKAGSDLVDPTDYASPIA